MRKLLLLITVIGCLLSFSALAISKKNATKTITCPSSYNSIVVGDNVYCHKSKQKFKKEYDRIKCSSGWAVNIKNEKLNCQKNNDKTQWDASRLKCGGKYKMDREAKTSKKGCFRKVEDGKENFYETPTLK